MAARATRSTNRKARVADAVATGPLGALSHDELGVVFDGLADPLQPVVSVALSSTCLGLRTPLQAALEVLKERHERSVALCRKMWTSCRALRDAESLLHVYNKGLTADDMATLGMILCTNGLPRLKMIDLGVNGFGDAGMLALCEGLGQGAAPSLYQLRIGFNEVGPAGAEALAAALRRGAWPRLETLELYHNPVGNQGVTALATSLRNLRLKELNLVNCKIGDEGVTSLLADLGKDDFKKLEKLYLAKNNITDAGVAKLLAALDAGGLPKLVHHYYLLQDNPASAVAVEAVKHALAKRGAPVG